MRKRVIRSQNRYLWSQVFAFFLLIGLGCQASLPTFIGDSRTFISNGGKYAINYPPNWVAFDFFPRGNNGNKEISAYLIDYEKDYPSLEILQKKDDQPTLEDAINWGTTHLKNRHNDRNSIELDELNYRRLGNKEIAERTYTTYTEGALSTRNKDVYLVEEDHMFILSFSSSPQEYEQDLEVFEEMIQSFEIKN